MESRGFPALWADDEYPTYFEKIFGEDKERQRKYLKAILDEDKVTLSVGNRVLGALMASGLCRTAFTTNFDTVLEKAVAEVGDQSLSAYHLEGAHSANHALNNEEYPIYCKLHGDFRYDSLKNLPDDLADQNADLAQCLVNAANRFGFIVTGYSGRDESIMSLFREVLESTNPFPHGLFWTGIKGSKINPAVESLLDYARTKGVDAHFVPVETFDALMLRLWRNINDKSPDMDAQVRKLQSASVHIPLPACGRGKPLLRLNAVPVVSIPTQCLELSFHAPKDWSELRQARNDARGKLILTKSDTVWCWGNRGLIDTTFGEDLRSIQPRDIPTDFTSAQSLHVKGFLEDALCAALARGKPLLHRTTRTSAFLIVNPHSEDKSDLVPISDVVASTCGLIRGLIAPASDDHPEEEQVRWSEAIRISLDIKNDQRWLLIDPDIWIWPARARRSAVGFMDRRRADRFNRKYNALIDAWLRVILGTDERNAEITFSAFAEGEASENPIFKIGSRTAFARRLVA